MTATTDIDDIAVALRLAEGPAAIVEAILEMSSKAQFRIRLTPGRCQYRHNGQTTQTTEIALPKTHLRAVLARLAVRCNELRPFCVTPYGGKTLLRLSPKKTPIQLHFANTPDAQFVDVRPFKSSDSQLRLMRRQIESLSAEVREVRQQLGQLALDRQFPAR